MMILNAALAAAASLSLLAATTSPQTDASPTPATPSVTAAPLVSPAPQPDARSVASDAEVGEARRAYRAQCSTIENAAFCDCVTAGVAQALAPAEVRMAARTIRGRLDAQGDAPRSDNSDSTPIGADAMTRIEQVEAHYADACAAYR